MDNVLNELLIALRKQKMIEEEWKRNNADTYKQYCKLLAQYFATEENIMKEHLKKQNEQTNKD